MRLGVITDENGHYAARLAPGKYTLSAGHSGTRAELQVTGFDDGDHATDRPGSLGMENIGDERDQSEIDSGHGCGGSGVCQTALEDDVHVHQAVADDGVAEAKRDQQQTENGGAHP